MHDGSAGSSLVSSGFASPSSVASSDVMTPSSAMLPVETTSTKTGAIRVHYAEGPPSSTTPSVSADPIRKPIRVDNE